MRWPVKWLAVVLAVTVLAGALRIPRLKQRPMHTDEAVHAVKFGELLERGYYRYDSIEYHGPTLNYLTLIGVSLYSAQNLSEVNEFTLRIVPALCGIMLVLFVFFLTGGLGKTVVIFAGLLTALSPAFVFYSRYYIQETLLVCFSFGIIVCAYCYLRTGKLIWILPAGIFFGLAHATKETCIIAFGSMAAALLITIIIQRSQQRAAVFGKKKIKAKHLVAAVVIAGAVSALFYSSFFSNPGGIAESLRAYGNYFGRAEQNRLHIHPWYYYLKMLIFSKFARGPVWSEGIIIVLGCIGFGAAITKKGLRQVDFGLIRFIAFYTLAMTIFYSAIPYKTPWCMLGFSHGMILLAGVGAAVLLSLMPNVTSKAVVSLLIFAGIIHLAWQSYLCSYVYYADPRNPYVYAHPTNDVFTITSRVKQVAHLHPQGSNIHIEVICPGHDYWPLPWYLRAFENVGWQDKVPENVADAQLILASPALQSALVEKLYESKPAGQKELYVNIFEKRVELRPGAELGGYVTKELWDRFE
ncbi:MAG: TIGR03663 family protein [Sedimentisphaerales bacterium]|nr:TIGR03663 family protein [Sedimentisphaerales bacterium]